MPLRQCAQLLMLSQCYSLSHHQQPGSSTLPQLSGMGLQDPPDETLGAQLLGKQLLLRHSQLTVLLHYAEFCPPLALLANRTHLGKTANSHVPSSQLRHRMRKLPPQSPPQPTPKVTISDVLENRAFDILQSQCTGPSISFLNSIVIQLSLLRETEIAVLNQNSQADEAKERPIQEGKQIKHR